MVRPVEYWQRSAALPQGWAQAPLTTFPSGSRRQWAVLRRSRSYSNPGQSPSENLKIEGFSLPEFVDDSHYQTSMSDQSLKVLPECCCDARWCHRPFHKPNWQYSRQCPEPNEQSSDGFGAICNQRQKFTSWKDSIDLVVRIR